jgi:hypothetical protein
MKSKKAGRRQNDFDEFGERLGADLTRELIKSWVL